ncbi:hypothetical protein ILUMI_19964 [Ignelater luminosus]|uniref:Uncharacterized protein n=1 Tax=Ignelater luminosus TaxID=2038154 RepID=A0A8K0CF63_IGNLU|nr:hypothetical protein ILUMI_19964 [Ignelater luminosus]
MARSVKNITYILKTSINLLIKSFQSTIYTQKSVRELTFEGYRDPILDSVANVGGIQTSKLCGWFYGKNGSVATEEEYYIASTDEKLKYKLFRNARDSGDDLQEILKSQTIQFSFPNTCKPFELNFDVKILSEYKYSLGSTLSHYEKLDLPKCTESFSIYTSLPHFLRANSSYLDAVEGLKPYSKKHETFIILETDSKTVLDCITRVQVNVLLQPFAGIQLYESVPEVMLPVFWVEEILAES